MSSRHKMSIAGQRGTDGVLQNSPNDKEHAILCKSLESGLKTLNELHALSWLFHHYNVQQSGLLGKVKVGS